MTLKRFAMGSLVVLGWASHESVLAADRLVFNSVTPCRIINTRLAAAGALAANETRTFHVVGSTSDFVAQGGKAGGCGLPGFAGPGQPQVQAVLVNVVAVTPVGAGDLRAWASDGVMPTASILNYAKVTDEALAGVSLNIANGIGLPVRQDVEGGDLSIKADVSSTHVVADVVGYWRYLTQVDGSGSGIDADLLDGLDSTAFAASVHTHPWSEITGKPAGFADDLDNDVLGGLSCATGEVAKWNGTAWACAADLVGGSTGWALTGNAGTNPATNFLGTTDNQPIELRVNNLRGLRIEPRATTGNYRGPNVVLGYEGNAVGPGVQGAVVAGSGLFVGAPSPNLVTGHFGTVTGGWSNRAGDLDSDPTTGSFATVGGGYNNSASGTRATVGGGYSNTASGTNCTVGGGTTNTASGTNATVGGGYVNTASGFEATVGGGRLNQAGGDHSFAAGNQAKVRDATQAGNTTGDQGTFVWADSTNADFQSTGPNQFLIRAGGGVGINKNNPGSDLDVAGTATVTGFRLTTSPSAGRVLTSDASGNGTWQPAAGGDITGVIAGTGLSGGGLSGDVTLSANTTVLQSRVTGTCAPGSSIRTVNGDGSVVCQADTTGADWSLTGNAGTNPATNFIGTTDNQAFELKVNNLRGLRIEPRAPVGTFQGPNILMGFEGNSLTAGVQGAVVAGGGGFYSGVVHANQVTGNFGTVGGGFDNTSGFLASVGGGDSNTASGNEASVGGGLNNLANSAYATVGGGYNNTAIASAATVGGGFNNAARGSGATVPGGLLDLAGGDYSFAAGRQARVRDATQSGDANGDEGTFVWADSTAADFTSTGPNQFLIRAGGGVAINTNTPVANTALTVSGNQSVSGSVSFGAQTRQMLNLWNTTYGIGVQAFTHYSRTDSGFAWYQGGVHSDAQNDPGTAARGR